MPEIEHCRSCKAPVIWCRLQPIGAVTPIDAEPCEHGNIALSMVKGEVIGRVLKKGEEYPHPRRTSHFATCPQAKQWRTKKK